MLLQLAPTGGTSGTCNTALPNTSVYTRFLYVITVSLPSHLGRLNSYSSALWYFSSQASNAIVAVLHLFHSSRPCGSSAGPCGAPAIGYPHPSRLLELSWAPCLLIPNIAVIALP